MSIWELGVNFVRDATDASTVSCAAPGGPPQYIQASSETSESIRVVWEPPVQELQHGDITFYTLMYVNSSLSEDEAHEIKISDPNQREYVITGLQKWTEYRVWMMAGTKVGAGLRSDAIMVRTDEDGTCQIFFCLYLTWE